MIYKVAKLFLFLLLGFLGGLLALKFALSSNILSSVPILLSEENNIYVSEEDIADESISKIQKSLVYISSQQGVKGCGLILTADGLMVTLSENIPSGSECSIFSGETSLSYQVLKRDEDLNLVLVKLDADNLATVGFFEMEDIKLNQKIFILGKVLDETSNMFNLIVNQGIVKSYNDNIVKTNIFEDEEIEGAPAFDIEGKIVGIFENRNDLVSIIPIIKIKQFCGL